MKTKLHIAICVAAQLLFGGIKSDAQFNQKVIAIGGAENDYGNSIIQTHDKGYAIAGMANTTNTTGQLYVIKLDSVGNLEWTRAIADTGSEGYSIIETSHNDLVIAGTTNQYGAGYDDVYVVNLDSAGNLKWTKTIGGIGDEFAYSIIQTYDKGFAITGSSASYGTGYYNVYIVKLDSAGNVKWAETIGGTDYDVGRSIIQTFDKGLAIAGYTASFGKGKDDMYIIKLDSAGNLKWTKTLGDTAFDGAFSLIQTSDKGLAVAGVTYSYGAGNGDAYIAKLDSAGNLKWTKVIGGKQYDIGYYITQSKDAGLVISGFTLSFDTVGSAYLIKLSSNGNLQWTRTIEGVPSDVSMIQCRDGSFALTGAIINNLNAYDVLFMKLDSNGNTCAPYMADSGVVSSGGITGSGGTITSVDSGKVSSGGTLVSFGTETDICGITASGSTLSRFSSACTLYPNPNNGVFAIKLPVGSEQWSDKTQIEIYNMLGEKVYSKQFTIYNSPFTINLSPQSAGIYMYRIISNRGSIIGQGKFIIQN